MEITLSATKIESIKRKCIDMISKPEVSIQELSSLIGALNATVEAVIPASMYVRELQMFETKSLLKALRNCKKK
jgi:type III secretion system FlhB-like substrate exporter